MTTYYIVVSWTHPPGLVHLDVASTDTVSAPRAARHPRVRHAGKEASTC